MSVPTSCDTFVVLPDCTAHKGMVFGKNSDRPDGEVQEVIYEPAKDYPSGSKLQCTYIEIDQVPHTHAVVLSKPSWMFGAEMGANEHGVCIGNEAVWTKLNGPEDEDEKLLGMDLLRLGLERAKTAREGVDVVTGLLEKHGQGGMCSDVTNMTYHNSFIIADPKEAWVLETAGQFWAAEKVTAGVRNISNELSIGTKIDLIADGAKDFAKKSGYWNGQSEFNFKHVFAIGPSFPDGRYACGKRLLEKFSAKSQFKVTNMFDVLRDVRSGICMEDGGGFVSTGSQVSVLPPPDSDKPSCHWFTATPNPLKSVYKPFLFAPGVIGSPHTKSPVIPDDKDPAKIQPRFQHSVDRSHALHRLHAKALLQNSPALKTLRTLEEKCISDMEEFLANFTKEKYSEVATLFKDIVESEMKFYK